MRSRRSVVIGVRVHGCSVSSGLVVVVCWFRDDGGPSWWGRGGGLPAGRVAPVRLGDRID
jgi:hypothetical protein